MRRFASVFAKKRDKPDTTVPPPVAVPAQQHHHQPTLSARQSLKRNLKRAQILVTSPHQHLPTSPSTPSFPPTPQLSSEGTPTLSSGSSASGSLRTPDDDISQHSHQPPRKRSWKWDRPNNDWQNRQPPPRLHSPPITNRTIVQEPEEDSDSDSSSESEDDPVVAANPPQTVTPVLPSPIVARNAVQNLSILIRNSLVPPQPVFPFLHQPGHPLFPRSCNPVRHLSPPASLRINTLKTNSLHHLQSSSSLTPKEEESIAPFGSRPVPAVLQSLTPSHDEPAHPKAASVPTVSEGVRQWIARPCFEDRYDVFLSTDGGISCQKVIGPPLGVAALEYSELLDLMVALDLAEPASPQQVDVTSNVSMSSPPPGVTPVANGSVPPPLHIRNPPYTATPSPLRNQHNTPEMTRTSPESSTQDIPSNPGPPSESKKGVRFAEEDKEDVIPLGYVLRMKQRRQEKAKFLRLEQEKREADDKRRQAAAKEAQERAQQELQRQQARLVKEKEKKLDEEGRQRLYAEEVAAARMRRESSRAGGVPALKSSTSTSVPPPLPSSPSSSSLYEHERNRARESNRHTRPHYDSSRREASEPAIMPTLSIPLSSPHSSSPGSSRRSSTADHSPVTPGSARGSAYAPSRPTSIYSAHTQSSSEDVRPRDNSKRSSMASMNSFRMDAMAGYPLWAASNPALVPPVPPVPTFIMDMPLLPPTAPFMLQQYPRQRSPGPSTSSSSRSRMRTNSNAERPEHGESPSSPPSPYRPEYRSSSSSLSSSHRHHDYRPTDQRRHSGESKRSSMPRQDSQRPPPVTSRSQPSTISRGRSARPAQLQPPSPWTALPSQSGQIPMTMPTYGLTSGGTKSSQGTSRRQTALM
ncbi:hypothetical protein BDN72DRAFT_351575 [Pluteus cervinus]|uniref:Uncharacterized protein n=1 Tax=Pluteus cervinus TaxID=181527 RepID=A0ACD3BD93_9AGAR|nr:hypothetical protein BDN72DRAFT_351575 [Pluteus cervinus]